MDKSQIANLAQNRAVPYFQSNTVRCQGEVRFRFHAARDYACLLDVDDEVEAWSCQSTQLHNGQDAHAPDFTVRMSGGVCLVDVCRDGSAAAPSWIAHAAQASGWSHRVVYPHQFPAIRLRNARDLLRYARFEISLSDRIRLLAALDAEGSLTVAECLSAFQRNPIPSLASLILHRFVAIDLDEQLIGPETQVRRRRDY